MMELAWKAAGPLVFLPPTAKARHVLMADVSDDEDPSDEGPTEELIIRTLYQAESLKAPPGVVIGDSGCRASVGGEVWHARHQEELSRLGLSWQEFPEKEYYRFGAGSVVESKRAYRYPCAVDGVEDYIRMSEVSGQARNCPGLVSPTDMGRWEVKFDFGDSLVSKMNNAGNP